MEKAYTLEGDVIVINRNLTELDLFVQKFLRVLEKHADYLIVSGYVSITTGRARGTEDVDLLVPAMDKAAFARLFSDLQKHGFWCYQGDSSEEAHDYLKNKTNLRFAMAGEMFPNMEMVPIDKT